MTRDDTAIVTAIGLALLIYAISRPAQAARGGGSIDITFPDGRSFPDPGSGRVFDQSPSIPADGWQFTDEEWAEIMREPETQSGTGGAIDIRFPGQGTYNNDGTFTPDSDNYSIYEYDGIPPELESVIQAGSPIPPLPVR